MHFQSLSPWKISSSSSSSPRPARYEATLPSDTAPGPVPGKSIRGSATGAGPLHIPPLWAAGTHQSMVGRGVEHIRVVMAGPGLQCLAGLSCPGGKKHVWGSPTEQGTGQAPCQPAGCVFQQDVQFHHLLVQASGCYITDLSVHSFGFLKCACPAPLASNMLLPALCTLQIWVPPWKASTAPAIFGTEVSIFLCCSLLGSAHSSPGALPAAHSPFLWQDFYVDHMAEP